MSTRTEQDIFSPVDKLHNTRLQAVREVHGHKGRLLYHGAGEYSLDSSNGRCYPVKIWDIGGYYTCRRDVYEHYNQA